MGYGQFSVKQRRLYDYNEMADSEVNFGEYLIKNHYDIRNRAYILHLGKNMISPVNEAFVRVSVPYKKAASGYGVIVLPKDHVAESNVLSELNKQVLYDVDFGDITSKLSVNYIDANGNKHSELESVRKIERYCNFTQNAYKSGVDMATRFHSCHAFLLDTVDQNVCQDMVITNIIDYVGIDWKNADFSRFSKFMMSFEDRTRDWELFDSDKKLDDNKLYTKLSEEVNICKNNTMKHIDDFCSKSQGLNRNAAPLYLNSFADGAFDTLLHNYMTVCRSIYSLQKNDYLTGQERKIHDNYVTCCDLKDNLSLSGMPCVDESLPHNDFMGFMDFPDFG